MSEAADIERIDRMDGMARDEAALVADFARVGSAGAVAHEYLDQVREELFRRHREGASGFAIVHELTTATDRLLRALFQHADAAHTRRRFSRLNQRLTVIARGGYGRGELNPRSDLDLIFLHDYKPGPYAEIVTEEMLHALYATGLDIGSAVRNIGECVSLAATELREKTAILYARYLAGDEKLYAQFEKKLVSDVLNRDQQNFFKAKLEETRQRHARYGDSIYLLEPNLKEGQGGLRDLHTALWLAKVKYNVRGLPELVQKALITEREFQEVTAAQDFIYRVRNSIHFLTGKHQDQLRFEDQEQVAPILAFRDRNGESASAQLMHAYYHQAEVVRQFSEGWLARVREEIAPGRFLWFRQSRQIRPGLVIQQQRVGLSDPEFFQRAPLNLITIFADCQAHNAELSGSAFQAVRENLLLIGDELQRNPQAGRALLGILRAPQRVAETLEAMHRAGVLGAIIPEFGNLDARVLHDLYHIYTVDRHSLAAVGYLGRLRDGEFKEDNALLTGVARDYDAMPLIFLALILHDIGKGHGHDHHERGALLTEQVCARLGLDSEATDLVVFLVRNHLWMSQVAQKGDVSDARTVEDFARMTGSIGRLKALYLMTFADMRAVAPKVYNKWRDTLLSDLYIKALRILEQGNKEAIDPVRRLALVKHDVREKLESLNAPAADIAKFVDLMPDRYFLTAPESEIGTHFEMMRALSEGESLVSRHRPFTQREYTEFTVVTADQPGLFAKVAGVLTANRLDILSGQITTRADGVVLDVFRVALGLGGLALEEEVWDRVNRDLERVLKGEQDIVEMVGAALYSPLVRRAPRRMETEVIIDNRSSEENTVVDVFCQDRTGLLFAITHSIFQLGYIIHLARISTNSDYAFDVFYITDGAGRKIEDLGRMRALKTALLERLEASPIAAAAG